MNSRCTYYVYHNTRTTTRDRPGAEIRGTAHSQGLMPATSRQRNQLEIEDPNWKARVKDTTIHDPQDMHCTNRSNPGNDEAAHHQSTTMALAEPPMLDYDKLVEFKLQSDLRFQKLFPNDAKRWVQ